MRTDQITPIRPLVRAIILGGGDSGPTTLLFAVAHPERAAALISLTSTA